MHTGRVAFGTAIAFAVSLICLLPPVIHFVTGPIGPLIGGYVAGSRMRLNSAEALVTGLLMGLSIGAVLIVAFEYLPYFPDLAWKASIPLSVVGALYIGVLGAVGAWFPNRGEN